MEESAFPLGFDPNCLQAEEADCELLPVNGGYRMEGYDSDCLSLDYPIKPSETAFEYMQKLGKMWHDRYAFKNACSEKQQTIVIVVPHPRRFMSRCLSFMAIPSSASTPLVAVEKEMEERVVVCVYAVDVYNSCPEEEQEQESYFEAIHLGSFPYREFMRDVEEFSPKTSDEKETARSLYPCWNLFEASDKEGKCGASWMILGCIDLSEHIPVCAKVERLSTEDQKAQLKALHAKSRKRCLTYWIPSYRNIDRPRVPFLAYEHGHVPRYTRLKEEAQNYATALGLGCFAYDCYKFNKRFLICTWDAAYRIVAQGDTFTFPDADRVFIDENCGRHLYEGMMPEFPQKLIMDLEYYTKHNPDLASKEDIDRLTMHALDYVTSFLEKMFGYSPALEDWIILDASSEKKASRHVILNAPNRYFRNMHDATYFRDVMKAYMEAGILLDYELVTRLLIRAEPKRDLNGSVIVASSIADQLEVEEAGKKVWKGSFIDWGIVNHTFRLMRTCFATKYGEDDRPFLEADMNRQKYAEPRDLFVNSLLGSVYPLEEEEEEEGGETPFRGWKVSSEVADEMIKDVRDLLLEKGITESSLGDNTVPSKKRKRGSSSLSRSKPRFASHTPLSKCELYPSDIRYQICVRSAKKSQPDLETLIHETKTWRVWIAWDSRNPMDSAKTPRFFWMASKESAYCPIVGTHHVQKGKMLLMINRKGHITAKCQAGRCNGARWALQNKNLTPKVLLNLWPHGLYQKSASMGSPQDTQKRF